MGCSENGMASLVLTRREREGGDFTGPTRILLRVKDRGTRMLQSSLWSQGMDLGVFSRMFHGGYGSHSQNQCSTSSHRLRCGVCHRNASQLFSRRR